VRRKAAGPGQCLLACKLLSEIWRASVAATIFTTYDTPTSSSSLRPFAALLNMSLSPKSRTRTLDGDSQVLPGETAMTAVPFNPLLLRQNLATYHCEEPMPNESSEIAKRYRETSLVQQSAAETLFRLLAIGGSEDVLDVGCGSGQSDEEDSDGDVGQGGRH
jgi:hypothetical protein